MKAGLVFLIAATALAEHNAVFETSQSGELVAELEMSSPGSDWAVAGREASVATVRVDDLPVHHVMLFAGPERYTYRVFLGSVRPGEHRISVERDATYSARPSRLEVHSVKFREIGSSDPDYEAAANAPVLFARKNTLGKFTDVPLLVYCERLPERLLQYTVIFSNEDGGTSTRALMARWGRTTDVEYVYKVWLDQARKPVRAMIQGPNHKELEYTGERIGSHPLLSPVTDNNMVAAGQATPLRYQLAPLIVDLANASRESVMDDNPITYQVMTKELIREQKLRPFGIAAAEKISDPRNYVFVDYLAEHDSSAMTVGIQLKNGREFHSDLGRTDFAIGRRGWVRSAIELPPKTMPHEIGRISFQCTVANPAKDEPLSHSGTCRLKGVSKAFQLNENALPRPSFWRWEDSTVIPSGQAASFAL